MNKNITKKVGVYRISNGNYRVTVWSPTSKRVQLMIKGQKVSHDLEKDDFGYWQKDVPEMAPGTHYKFLLDNDLERPDPASAFQPEGVHSWSEAVDHESYAWGDKAWIPPSMEEMVIYELHVGTFTPEGTFESVTDKLDHLLDLGVNAIEIMPIAQF